MSSDINRKILVIDDSPAIHEDFRKILTREPTRNSLEEAKVAFLGAASARKEEPGRTLFEMHSAHQGEEGLAMLKHAREVGEPYAMAFVDVRMPPGWDGVRTIENLWKEDSELEVVMCTAYSDYSWNETINKLGSSDQLLILKKPFDPVEICQLASALTAKWSMRQRERTLVKNLTRKEQEARAYASSLETVNRALESNQAMSGRSDQLKNEFVVRLSGALRGSVESLLERATRACSSSGEQTLEDVESLLLASQRILSNLDELGTLAELDAGQLEYKPVELCPTTLAEAVLDSVRPLADAKGLALGIVKQTGTPELALLDESCLRRILDQLLRNAIEHTTSGSVTLQIGVQQTNNWKEQQLRFEVQDTGSGIAPEVQATIFEPFYHQTEEGQSMGTGLGLTVVKRLAQLMRAELSVKSAPGAGSCFQLTLPASKLLPS